MFSLPDRKPPSTCHGRSGIFSGLHHKMMVRWGKYVVFLDRADHDVP
jgi:hypothetical protein